MVVPAPHAAIPAGPTGSRLALGRYLARMSEEREILDYATYGAAVMELSAMVANDGYRPEMILAIARGGLFVAGSMGYALSVKNIYVMNCEYYTGVDERLPVPVVLPPYVDFVDMDDAKILIADDVADTGHTLKLVHDFCIGRVGEVRTAVLYEKSHSLVKCDYVWKRTNRWINFPWSTDPPVVSAKDARRRVADGRRRRRRQTTGRLPPLGSQGPSSSP